VISLEENAPKSIEPPKEAKQNEGTPQRNEGEASQSNQHQQ
jgi:hypothetical protein